ncbi:MAG: protein tyrosine phosphatase family protein [Gloeobacterales cyanobacterium]
METIRKITHDLAIAGQIGPEQLQQIAQEGFKSVLNLQTPDEKGFLINEQQQVEDLGLRYVHMPIALDAINHNGITTQVLQQIAELTKPVLVHCSSDVRAAAMVLMYIATRQGVPLDKALQQAEKLGLFKKLSHVVS